MKKEPAALKPHWPEGLEEQTLYRVPCDDKGRRGGSWLQVFVAVDGDVHVTMQDWEDIDEPGSTPNPIPSIRVRWNVNNGWNQETTRNVPDELKRKIVEAIQQSEAK